MMACSFRARIVRVLAKIIECEIIVTRNSLITDIIIYKLIIQWVYV